LRVILGQDRASDRLAQWQSALGPGKRQSKLAVDGTETPVAAGSRTRRRRGAGAAERVRPVLPDLFYNNDISFYNNDISGWGPALCARRPEITMAMVDAFLNKMYRASADFVFTVSRDFVRHCRTPIRILPDDVPAHPYAVAIETARLSPNFEVSLYPWKDTEDHLRQAVQHVRRFLRAHQPVKAAAE
jgi:hypothetical protein